MTVGGAFVRSQRSGRKMNCRLELEKEMKVGYTHIVKTIADSRRRVTLPPTVNKGDVFDLAEPESGRFVLVKLSKPKKPKGRLVLEDGVLVIETDEPITDEMVRKALADFP